MTDNAPAPWCGIRVRHDAHDHLCDSGCQPDWHRDDCAIYLRCPGSARDISPGAES